MKTTSLAIIYLAIGFPMFFAGYFSLSIQLELGLSMLVISFICIMLAIAFVFKDSSIPEQRQPRKE